MQTLIGLIFIINAFVVGWLFNQDTILDDASAMIGATSMADSTTTKASAAIAAGSC